MNYDIFTLLDEFGQLEGGGGPKNSEFLKCGESVILILTIQLLIFHVPRQLPNSTLHVLMAHSLIIYNGDLR